MEKINYTLISCKKFIEDLQSMGDYVDENGLYSVEDYFRDFGEQEISPKIYFCQQENIKFRDPQRIAVKYPVKDISI